MRTNKSADSVVWMLLNTDPGRVDPKEFSMSTLPGPESCTKAFLDAGWKKAKNDGFVTLAPRGDVRCYAYLYITNKGVSATFKGAKLYTSDTGSWWEDFEIDGELEQKTSSPEEFVQKIEDYLFNLDGPELPDIDEY